MHYAHSAPDRKDWEPLADHLRGVAERAAGFAAAFDAADEARLAGLLHDLGKYSDRFTARLEGKARGLDHWSIGALAAGVVAGPSGQAAALAVHGHHVGLSSRETLRAFPSPTLDRSAWTETDPRTALERLRADGLEPPRLETSIFSPPAPRGGAMLDVRMLFSTLVDADFLATEAHFQRFEPPPVARPGAPPLEPERALSRLDGEIARIAAASTATVAPAVRALRDELLAACRKAAEQPLGTFTLTAPTGSGKTLAMLDFALRHAARHGLRRIVLAVPYLAILEQTAGIVRALFDREFGEGYVLEHHSLAGLRTAGFADEEADPTEQRRRLLAENWDAPIVLTTSVQLFESLFANRPAPCRKLHRLASSVILFDEAQTLPPMLAAATLAALSRLAERYRTTVVFATATQPAFDHLDGHVRPLAARGWQPREIVPESLGLFARVRRTRPVWDLERPKSWEEIAAEILSTEQGLAIVNLKRHALALARAVQAVDKVGLFHLSTNLCPAHRERVLAEVRRCLAAGEPCRLIATQCVEAGVDVDFPRAWRAFGPLEAIAQAAGRCNRNGRSAEPGEVRIFQPDEKVLYPPGAYAQAATAARALVDARGPDAVDLDDPALYRDYYRDFFDGTRLGEGNPRLKSAIQDIDFAAVAAEYRLIDKDAIEVLVPDDPEAFAALTVEARERPYLTASWIRRARRYAVSLYRPKTHDPRWSVLEPAVRVLKNRGEHEERNDWFVLTSAGRYDRGLFGLLEAEEVWIA